jgi:nucleotide-binding universal stress UspA family protein
MKMYEKILVATDGSSYSEEAVEYAINLAKASGAELIALHVATIDPSIGMIWEDVKDIVMTRQGTMLEDIKKEAEKRGVDIRTIIEQGIPSEKIIETAEKEGADVIIMGSHGHSGLEKILVGSVTERVIGGTSLPVMVVSEKRV